MFILIERYMNNMSILDLKNLAVTKNIDLSDEELDFSYKFVQNNWRTILANHGLFDIDKYKDKFTEENFVKIKKLVKEYSIKYSNYL